MGRAQTARELALEIRSILALGDDPSTAVQRIIQKVEPYWSEPAPIERAHFPVEDVDEQPEVLGHNPDLAPLGRAKFLAVVDVGGVPTEKELEGVIVTKTLGEGESPDLLTIRVDGEDDLPQFFYVGTDNPTLVIE